MRQLFGCDAERPRVFRVRPGMQMEGLIAVVCEPVLVSFV